MNEIQFNLQMVFNFFQRGLVGLVDYPDDDEEEDEETLPLTQKTKLESS